MECSPVHISKWEESNSVQCAAIWGERHLGHSELTVCTENFACSELLFWWGRRARVSLCHPGWTGTWSIARMTLNSWPSSCLIFSNIRIIFVSPHTVVWTHTRDSCLQGQRGREQNRKARSRFPICPATLFQFYQYTHSTFPKNGTYIRKQNIDL